MAARIWLLRAIDERGRVGLWANAPDDLAASLIKKGDALPFDNNLRRALAERRGRGDKAAEGKGTPGKRRGRPPKDAPPESEAEAPLAPDAEADAPMADNAPAPEPGADQQLELAPDPPPEPVKPAPEKGK